MAESYAHQVSENDDEKLSLDDSTKEVKVKKFEASSAKDAKIPLSSTCSEDDDLLVYDVDALRENAMAKLPSTIGDLRVPEWDEIRTLNKKQKLSRESYAYFADEFDFKAKEVEYLSKMTDPVGEILSQNEKQPITRLIDALLNTGNARILSKLIGLRCKDNMVVSPFPVGHLEGWNKDRQRSKSSPEKQPQMEVLSSYKHNSLGGRNSLPSENSDPLAESWNSSISSLDGGYVYQGIPAEDYHSEESKQFWESIEGSVEEKSVVAFERCVEILYQYDSSFARERKSRVMKFIAAVLDVSLANPVNVFVRRLDFVQLVACFGPTIATKDGCFEKIFDLTKRSLVTVTRKRRKEKESWFAGKMSMIESHEHLKRFGSGVGDFLVRFSESKAREGYFVLAFLTKDEGPVEIQIENDPKAQILTLGRRQFKNLPDLVAKCRMDPFSDHNVVLAQPCPNLGMTAVCKGYSSCKKPKV